MYPRHLNLSETDEAGGGSAAAGDPAATGAAAGAAKTGAAGEAAAKSEGAAKGDAGAEKVEAKAGEKDATKGYWPEDWRKTMAGDSEKELAQAQRYGSPAEVWKKARALEQKLSSGELKPVLGKDAKPEEVTAYREALGIPATPDKYDLKDVKVDEGDKAFVAELFKTAHATNQTPEQVAANVKTWNEIKTAAVEQQATRDQELQTKGEDALRSEWGTEYRRNINLVHSLLDGSGSPEMKDKFLTGRLSDGTPIGSDPAALKMLLGLALVQNPQGVIVPSGTYSVTGMEDRIKEIEKMMREDRKAYNDPKISGPNGEYTKLLAARETMKARQKAA